MSAVEPIEAPLTMRQDAKHRVTILAYIGILAVLANFASPAGGLIEIPVSFFLKNKLHLEAHEVAAVRLVAAIPLFLSVVFGFIRDIWTRSGRHDRGFLAVFATISAGLFGLFAIIPMGFTSFLVAIFTLTTASLFVTSAQNGLTTLIAQQQSMTGQVSAAWNSFWSISTVIALAVGGLLSDRLEETDGPRAMQLTFLIGAGLMAAIAVYAIWKPDAVFDRLHAEAPDSVSPGFELRRLLAHRPVYPALGIWMMWCFAPGSATPLQYYLQNTLHAADIDWGLWNAIFFASLTPTFLIFGILCQRIPLKTLLFWATIVAIPQFVPMLMIGSITGALIAAVPIGLMGGAATAAYVDLIMRSAPRGLQGATLMMASGLYYISARFGDIVGTAAYDVFGSFWPCVVMTTLAYALILPALTSVPPELAAQADGADG